jgi:hypothetical protein
MCLHLDVEPVGILLSSWQLQHMFLLNNSFVLKFSLRIFFLKMLKIQNLPFSFKFFYLNFFGEICTISVGIH